MRFTEKLQTLGYEEMKFSFDTTMFGILYLNF